LLSSISSSPKWSVIGDDAAEPEPVSETGEARPNALWWNLASVAKFIRSRATKGRRKMGGNETRDGCTKEEEGKAAGGREEDG